MIKKAIIPAAGFGTRFLPTTKAQPKEMLPIVDKPTIQFVVEEAVNSGITDILIITGRGKQAIENHFDRTFELEEDLKQKEKFRQLKEIQHLAKMADIHYIRQRELNGLGDAIRYAKNHVHDEPFVVLLGDTIVDSEIPCTRQLIDVFNKYGKPTIGLEQVPREKSHRYGIVDVDAVPNETDVFLIKNLVEKPDPADAPSDLAIGGRYILTPRIFEYIERTTPGKNGEIQLTDAIRLMNQDIPYYGFKFSGTRHDIGNRLDYLKTIVEFGIKREDIGHDFKAFLRDFVKGM